MVNVKQNLSKTYTSPKMFNVLTPTTLLISSKPYKTKKAA